MRIRIFMIRFFFPFPSVASLLSRGDFYLFFSAFLLFFLLDFS